MDVNKIIKSCSEKLEKNLVSTAIRELHDSVYENENKIYENGEIRLLYSRLLGHLGELSEALRNLGELEDCEKVEDDQKVNGIIYKAMCWSRLKEFNKAKKILTSIEPPSNIEYLVNYYSHLMSIAFETKNDDDLKSQIAEVKSLMDQNLIHGIALQEIQIWLMIFQCALKENLNNTSILKVKKEALDIMNSSGKKSFTTYIYLRIGNLYELISYDKEALECYEEAKKKAFDGNHGIALIMANLAILRILKNQKTVQTLIKETCVVAGQHGIGLIQCELSFQIWKLIEQLSDKDALRCKQWLLTERYLPDIERLTGDDFEDLCKKTLESHGKDLFQSNITVKRFGTRKKTIDLEVNSTSSYNPLKIAVQCKGGGRKWSESKLQAELEKNESSFRSKLNKLKDLEGYNGYTLMLASPISQPAKKWLDEVHKDVFKTECNIIFNNDIKSFLRENPQLRTTVTMALNK